MDYKEKIIALLNNEELSQELREKLEGILLEFAEGKDERTRKAILAGLIDCRDAPDLGWSNFGGVNIDECIAWLEKQGDKDNQVTLPTFTFNDILALQCCMETVKKVQEDKDLYEKLNDLHGRLYDAYHLEKQGEQKQDPCEHCKDKCLNCHNFPCIEKRLFDQGKSEPETIKEEKVASKFEVGKWITNGDYNWKIVDVKPLVYILQSQDGNIVDDTISYVDEHFHLWTIKDAKDGDVLAFNDGISGVLLYKGYLKSGVFSYCRIIRNSFIDKEESGWGLTLLSPATKKQCDLLFHKMKDAGYVWDAVKKTLRKKVESKTLDPDKVITEAYCSSKVAKLFKEKGFNVPVWTRYEGEEDKDVVFGDKYDWNNDTRERTSAPTHQMALKWLREVHKISIEVFACCDKYKDGKIWSYTICKIYDAANDINPRTPYYKTYEETVEAALIYCLKKIL